MCGNQSTKTQTKTASRCLQSEMHVKRILRDRKHQVALCCVIRKVFVGCGITLFATVSHISGKHKVACEIGLVCYLLCT